MRTEFLVWLVACAVLTGCPPVDPPWPSDDDDIVGDDDDAVVGVIAASITPAAPSTFDDLEATITRVDGGTLDPAHLSWTWSVDANPRPDLVDTAVAADETTRGQTWTFTVSFDDGDGLTDEQTAEVTVVNMPPTATGVTLSPDTVFTDTQITATPVGFNDAEGDPTGWSYQWFVDDTPTGENQDFLAISEFVKGQEIYVEVQPDDGYDLGSAVVSDAITVQNTPPTAPGVSIAPSGPMAGVAPLICSVSPESADADSDDITYTFSWELDGQAYPDTGGPWTGPTSTSDPNDTVPAEDTDEGQTWTCFALPYDGEEHGPIGQASETTVAVATVPDFSLIDDNSTSSTYGMAVSPRDYLMVASGWYFGHST